MSAEPIIKVDLKFLIDYDNLGYDEYADKAMALKELRAAITNDKDNFINTLSEFITSLEVESVNEGYCPECGERLITRGITNGDIQKYCDDCGWGDI